MNFPKRKRALVNKLNLINCLFICKKKKRALFGSLMGKWSQKLMSE